MTISNVDSIELLERFNFLIQQYVPLAAELAPKFEKFGKYRKELQAICVELKNRGIVPEEPEHLKQTLEDLLKTRGIQSNEEHPEMEGRPATGTNS